MLVAVLGPLLAFWLLAPGAARACSCAGDPIEPDAVFVGTVVGEEGFVPSSLRARWALWTFFRISFEGHRYRVHAKTSWLGLNRPSVTIVTGFGSGDCGAPVEVGKSYLFRTTRGPDGDQRMGACGLRPEPVDLSTFDEAMVPLMPGGEIVHWPALPPRPNPWRWLPLAPGMVAVLSILGWVGVRRLRSRRVTESSTFI
ncbi:MAG: hypothetical protein JW751_14335 [Polyangiaceae bacterium]|nr:hypothetical protein [Polyangiaceae bacterium]